MRGRSPRSGSSQLFGPNGLAASYRSLFEGEGRNIVLQAVVAFVGGLCEALVLVVLAKLAFAIGGDDQQLSGLGPLQSIELSVGTYFQVAVVLALARAGFQALAGHLTASVVARSVTRVREGTFLDYAHASWEAQAAYEEAAIQDLLTRHVTRATSVVQSISLAFYMFFTMAALLVSAVVIDPVASVLVVGSGAVLFSILRPLSNIAKRYARLQLEAGRRFAASSLEAISLSLEIRAFGVNEEVARRLAEDTEAEVRPIYVSQFLQRIVLAVYQLFAVTILLVGLYAVYEFLDRPLASLGAIVIILVRSLNIASNVQGVYHTVVETAPFADELNEQREHFRDSVPPSGSEPVPADASLAFEQVSYRYTKEADLALDDVSFNIHHGEAVGVVGPSGSGKSTLIQLVLRLRQPSTGRYLVGGVDAGELRDKDWFERVAFVPQDCQTVSDDVMENIRFFRPWISDEDVISAAKRAHVHEEILAMPDGYRTDLGSRGGGLSGGQRQRVAIARALAGNPQLLVLDEPTSALDMRSESLVHETLTELQGSVTMLIIAHRLSTLKTCDRIIVMGSGRLQAFGERSQLEADNAFYREAIALSKLRS
ncbi:MAG: ABC transporter ATP-binding protein [Actinobacteria bacterium]|nr:ABC transporter ATP-binding protein [Actinomycetota bacterium]